MEEINSLEDIKKVFTNESIAGKYVQEIRWGKWASCPYCNNKKVYMFKNGKCFKCANKSCYKRFTGLCKTMFFNSKLPLTKWLEIFYLYSKSRGRIGAIELAQTVNINQRTEYFVREKIDFVWKLIERHGKTNTEIINELISKFCYNYDLWLLTANAPYHKNPYAITNIDDISDPVQYNQLIRYAKYFVEVYCHWIFLDFASPQDIVAETFLWMRDNDIKYYGGTQVVKYVQQSANRMWYNYITTHPKYHDKFRLANLRCKDEQKTNLKDTYIIEILFSKRGNTLSRQEIRKNKELIQVTRDRIISKRKKNNNLYDFNSAL